MRGKEHSTKAELGSRRQGKAQFPTHHVLLIPSSLLSLPLPPAPFSHGSAQEKRDPQAAAFRRQRPTASLSSQGARVAPLDYEIRGSILGSSVSVAEVRWCFLASHLCKGPASL